MCLEVVSLSGNAVINLIEALGVLPHPELLQQLHIHTGLTEYMFADDGLESKRDEMEEINLVNNCGRVCAYITRFVNLVRCRLIGETETEDDICELLYYFSGLTRLRHVALGICVNHAIIDAPAVQTSAQKLAAQLTSLEIRRVFASHRQCQTYQRDHPRIVRFF
jgi:hypothetical protein